MASHSRIAERDRSVLLTIDMQESYRGKLLHEEEVLRATTRLLDAAGILGIPVLVTEQYPERLGATRSEIAEHLPADLIPFPKRAFSCLGAEGVRERLRELKRDQVIVTGIETHVCVNQTVHDLLADRYQVHVVRDATTSRFALEDENAFGKMIGSGAIPASVEALLFEWVGDSRSPDFKAIHRLVV